MERAPRNFDAARRLRREQTATEALLWERLRARQLNGLKFRRQHALGAFVLDFYCAEHALAIEIDGPIHRGAKRRERDRQRQATIEEAGIRFLRFTVKRVEHDLDGVLRDIRRACSPSPGALGEGVGG